MDTFASTIFNLNTRIDPCLLIKPRTLSPNVQKIIDLSLPVLNLFSPTRTLFSAGMCVLHVNELIKTYQQVQEGTLSWNAARDPFKKSALAATRVMCSLMYPLPYLVLSNIYECLQQGFAAANALSQKEQIGAVLRLIHQFVYLVSLFATSSSLNISIRHVQSPPLLIQGERINEEWLTETGPYWKGVSKAFLGWTTLSTLSQGVSDLLSGMQQDRASHHGMGKMVVYLALGVVKLIQAGAWTANLRGSHLNDFFGKSLFSALEMVKNEEWDEFVDSVLDKMFYLINLMSVWGLTQTYYKEFEDKMSQSLVSPMDPSLPRLDEVIGCDEAKEEVSGILDMTQHPENYPGQSPPKGILFHGPAGTGKTMLAKALARELGGRYLYKNGSDFIRMYIGTGPESVRALFSQAEQLAKKTTPPSHCVIFIDEIDALLSKRSDCHGDSGSKEFNATVNAFLSAVEEAQHVTVIGATNLLSNLDEAAIRSGRFDAHIRFTLPGQPQRTQILTGLMNKHRLPSDLIPSLVEGTAGWSGADLKSMVCGVAQRTARSRSTATLESFEPFLARRRPAVSTA